jgi:hypothetical protein
MDADIWQRVMLSAVTSTPTLSQSTIETHAAQPLKPRAAPIIISQGSEIQHDNEFTRHRACAWASVAQRCNVHHLVVI